jgi:hypothetical protein
MRTAGPIIVPILSAFLLSIACQLSAIAPTSIAITEDDSIPTEGLITPSLPADATRAPPGVSASPTLQASIEVQPSETPAPAPTLPPGTPILPPGGEGAATGLNAEVGCSEIVPRTGIANLNWNAAAPSGSEQRIALTIFPDGFETGNFEVTEALPPNQSSLVWEPLEGQAIHYWRVLTLHSKGWVPSDTASFEGPTCVADYQP